MIVDSESILISGCFFKLKLQTYLHTEGLRPQSVGQDCSGGLGFQRITPCRKNAQCCKMQQMPF